MVQMHLLCPKISRFSSKTRNFKGVRNPIRSLWVETNEIKLWPNLRLIWWWDYDQELLMIYLNWNHRLSELSFWLKLQDIRLVLVYRVINILCVQMTNDDLSQKKIATYAWCVSCSCSPDHFWYEGHPSLSLAMLQSLSISHRNR